MSENYTAGAKSVHPLLSPASKRAQIELARSKIYKPLVAAWVIIGQQNTWQSTWIGPEISEGAAITQRKGKRIYITGVRITMDLTRQIDIGETPDETYWGKVYRIIIVRDRKHNNSATVEPVADVLQTGTFTSPYNNADRLRNVILYDQVHIWNSQWEYNSTQTNFMDRRTVDVFIPLNFYQTYSGTGAGMTNVIDNFVSIYWRANGYTFLNDIEAQFCFQDA